MADIADLAQVVIDAAEHARIERIRALAAAPIVNRDGTCLSCGEPVPTPRHRWCDADCRDAYLLRPA